MSRIADALKVAGSGKSTVDARRRWQPAEEDFLQRYPTESGLHADQPLVSPPEPAPPPVSVVSVPEPRVPQISPPASQISAARTQTSEATVRTSEVLRGPRSARGTRKAS